MKTALKWVACMILCGVLLTLGVFSDAPAGDNVSDSPEQSARPGYTETVRYIEPAKGAFQIHDQQDARFGLQFNVEAETPGQINSRRPSDWAAVRIRRYIFRFRLKRGGMICTYR